MKIGIDVFGCNHARSGVGSYLLNILSNLPLQDDLSIELFGPEIDRYTYNSENELPFISLPIADNLTIQRNWHRRKIKKFLKKKKYDIVLFPAPTGPSIAIDICFSKIKHSSRNFIKTIYVFTFFVNKFVFSF